MSRLLLSLAVLALAGACANAEAPPPKMNVQVIEHGRYKPVEVSTRGCVIYEMADTWLWRGYDRTFPPGRYLCGPRIVFRLDPASGKWLEVPGRLIIHYSDVPRTRVERITLDD